MQSIIITGANSGIGLECTKQFCETFKDRVIVAISRSDNNLQELKYHNLEIKKCDVTNYEELNLIIQNVAVYVQISGLINCAGVSYNGDFCDIKHEDIEQIIDINIKGITNCIELVLPYMRKQKIGTIINLSSLSDRNPRPVGAIYAASKAYVRSLSDSLRVSEAKYNIRVSNIAPAIIDTPMIAELKKDTGSLVSVADFVNIIKFIYEQPDGLCIRDMVVAPTSYEK